MKRNLKTLALGIIACVIAIVACQKDFPSKGGVPDPTVGATISATVVGRIVNEQNQPVAGAIIKAGSTTATTDVNGEFRINNATVNDAAAFVTAEKAGYFTGSRTFIARQNQKHYVEIMLLAKQTIGSINGTSGGTINLGNGSAITLPANGVVTANTGNAYSGNVNVAMTWINPTSTDLYRQMPGDLRGTDATGAANFLQSFGMLGVELTGSGGEKLQIATGKKANLKFPLPASIQGAAPATIALWSFNDTTGLWKQEGTATKSGNFYLADVSHFSFWNCDAGFPLAKFTATIVTQTGQPFQHAVVRIKRANGSYGYGYTDSSGYVQGQVPANEALTLEILSSYTCGNTLYTQNIGPFAANTTNPLGTVTITLAAANITTITGTVVNCSNAPVTNGFVNVVVGFSTYRATLSSTGTFSLPFSTCNATPQITYYAVDNTANQQSTPVTVTLTTSTTALGSIAACGVSTQRFINYTINGTNYSIAPPDSISVFQGGQGTSAGTSVNGSNSSGNFIFFNFSGTAIGTFPLASLSASTSPNLPGFAYTSNSSTVTTTEYSTAVGGYITGSFNAILRDSATNTNHPIQCTFRVRR
jgi:hypothetical protein